MKVLFDKNVLYKKIKVFIDDCINCKVFLFLFKKMIEEFCFKIVRILLILLI